MSYNIYVAKIVGVSTIGDDRLQVRILPHMDDENIPDNKCPLYPYFFKYQTITGKNDDLVWVIADDDFSSGYILGYANYNTVVENDYTSGKVNEGDQEDTNFSISRELRVSLSKVFVDLVGISISFNNVKVTYWSEHCVHMIDMSTGGSYILYDTGSVMVMRPDMFVVAVKQDSTSAKSGIFKIDSNGVSFSGNTVKLQGDSVLLGKNPVSNVLIAPDKECNAITKSDYVKA